MYFRLNVISVCFVAILALCSASAKVANTPVAQPELREVKVVTNIRDFVRSHPGVRVLSLRKEAGKARNQSVRYTIGGRVSGDRLVAQSADVYAYPAKKDVTLQITYPESGNGSIVTYIEIVCTQDNDNGNAYVVAGGVGQRLISIVLEANQTENFSYSAHIYGRD